MKVERDIAGFSLPFAAGVMAAVYAGDISGTCQMHFSAAAIFAACLFTAVLMQRKGKRRRPEEIFFLAMCAAFACGIFTGMTGHMLACSTITGNILAGRHLTAAAEQMGHAIDALPFDSGDTNAIIKALLTGNRSGLTNEIQDAFRNSGASHILALSGLHLGIIYMAIRKILAFTGNHPAAACTRSVLTVVFCGMYAAATGAGPSITRAFLFILLGETARVTGRRTSTAGIMMAALTIQMTASPMSAAQAGFQMSYAAMAGIAFIYPVFRKIWDKDTAESNRAIACIGKLPRIIWNSAAISISCQLTTGPVAYLYFGTFPLNFILTNLIAVPLTGAVIPAALAALFLSYAGICPDFLLDVLEAAVRTLHTSLEIIAGM